LASSLAVLLVALSAAASKKQLAKAASNKDSSPATERMRGGQGLGERSSKIGVRGEWVPVAW